MKHTRRIATVTVTYNAEQIIARQIEALRQQSYPIDEVIVVDCASKDATRGVLEKHYPEATVIRLPTNEGIGGGVAAGLQYAALQKAYDWIWILDADTVPCADSLEALIGALDSNINVTATLGLIASSPKHSETKLRYSGFVWNKGWKTPIRAASGLCFVDAVISSGSLISRDVVQKVGLPRSDFFMDFVDFEYCLRMRRAGYKIAVVEQSILEHSIGEPRTSKVLGFSHAWGAHSPWREYYFSRNYIFMIESYYPDWRSRAYVLYRLLRHALAIVLFGVSKMDCLRMMWFGYKDGRAGRLGIRFTSETEQVRTPLAACNATGGE